MNDDERNNLLQNAVIAIRWRNGLLKSKNWRRKSLACTNKTNAVVDRTSGRRPKHETEVQLQHQRCWYHQTYGSVPNKRNQAGSQFRRKWPSRSAKWIRAFRHFNNSIQRATNDQTNNESHLHGLFEIKFYVKTQRFHSNIWCLYFRQHLIHFMYIPIARVFQTFKIKTPIFVKTLVETLFRTDRTRIR